MRGFNDARFANSFGRIHMAANPGLKRYAFSAAGVVWQRKRHSFHDADYSFQGETFILNNSDPRKGWSLLVATETWWEADGKSVMRSQQWARLLSGRKADALAWFKAQEDALR